MQLASCSGSRLSFKGADFPKAASVFRGPAALPYSPASSTADFSNAASVLSEEGVLLVLMSVSSKKLGKVSFRKAEEWEGPSSPKHCDQDSFCLLGQSEL